jgi:hypothetical protein
MTPHPLGDELRALCAAAQRSVFLVAPFIKAAPLERLLRAIPTEVAVLCVTRWVPIEIVNGVSDLEVWPLLRDRNAWLGLSPRLHAKYYRVDEQCRVGSANLTDAALGWKARANLELWVDPDPDRPDLRTFESELHRAAVPVDDALYLEHCRAVERLREIMPPPPAPEAQAGPGPRQKLAPPEQWLPGLRHPEDLYRAYVGESGVMTRTAWEDAQLDLAQLDLPPALPRPAFDLHVRMELLQMPIVRALDDLLEEPRRFGAVRSWLWTQPCAEHGEFDATEAWQVLMRWLLHFAGDRYMSWTPNYTEVFARRAGH